MCQSPQELYKDDLSSAYVALEFMTKAGFKMDWLEKKLDEVSQKKEKEEVGETKLQGMEEKLKDLKQMKIYSDQFVVGGCKWCLRVCPKGNDFDYLFIYLEAADYGLLPTGWRRHARYLFNIVNQNSVKRFKQSDAQKWFDEKCPRWGSLFMFPMNEIHANGEVKVVVEVEVLEVIGKSNVSEETSTIVETMDVNGFQLPSSQVEIVNRLFERHPEIASEFRSKNPNLRTGYMSLLLSLIETLRQSSQELLKADLAEAYAALRSMTDAGFKLDWLKKKLNEMSEKKEKEEASENRMQEIMEEMENLKQKYSDLQAQLKKEKAEMLAAIVPISFDDVI
ncbi:hypothetical protein AALP_AA5G229300 [Arabis alpina]|uniref:MATH domain-containing protein n=1 Tax=Arabis alpina TaxID=50452 RepID=A0A087GYV5_ARAAL|nr:hypothetical protein AALP_AA5G229300 [Arabis alpina]